MLIIIILAIMAIGGCGMLLDKYRVRRYRSAKLWEQVEKFEEERRSRRG
ncbi:MULTISPECIES: hypothetical protein [Bacillus]|nr:MULTISPECIES: hypothetical protein [Bacillus]MDF3254974.1 hypothetical protein [Bacillus velezensis]MDF3267797.1 hypothetical protein [Bacillus velezensis]